VVQETLIAVHTRRATYDATQPFTAWVYAIARYKLIDHLRRSRRRAAIPIEDCEELFSYEPGAGAEAMRDVDVLLSELSPAQRDAIRLTRLDGLSVEEAAARTGQSISSIKVGVHRGLKKLGAFVAQKRP
jgi:RNA polymerase sigma-70 factor (ECF subfamily)